MTKRTHRIAVIALVICVLLSACAHNSAAETRKPSGLERTVSYLTSDELSGRLVGTEGNEKAADYIESSFADLGLEPFFEGRYSHMYTQNEVFLPEECAYELQFFVDGEWKAAEPGRDFIPAIRHETLTGEFERTGSDADFSEKAILLAEGESMYDFEDKPKPALFLTVGDAFLATRPSMDETPSIRLTESGAKLAARAERVQVNIDIPLQEKEAKNIAGFISGRDHTRAVVVSAHFDHVGTIEETIFPGGHDNASGLSVMLEIARILAEREETPAADIIFCAFNGEENAQQGSAALVSELSYDWLWDLNLDCLGSPNEPRSYVVVSDTENDPLVRSMLNTLNLRDCKAEYGDMISDHLSFQNAGYCAVTVGQDSQRIHVPDDDGTDLNFEEMERLAKILSEYVWDNAAREFTPAEAGIVAISFEEWQALQKRVNEALEKALAGHTLAYDEEIYFTVDEDCYVRQGGAPLLGIEEVRKYHPDWDIPEAFAGLTLESAYLTQGDAWGGARPKLYFGMPPELNTVLKRSLEHREDSTLSLVYREGLREMAIQYGAVLGTDGVNKESLDGDYRRFTLYSHESIKGDFYNEIFVPLNNGKNLLVTVQNVEILSEPMSFEETSRRIEDGTNNGTPITVFTDINGEFQKITYDLGNNTREDMIELVAILYPALVERGLLN